MTLENANKEAKYLNKLIEARGLVATVHVYYGDYYIIVLPKVEQMPQKFTSSLYLN